MATLHNLTNRPLEELEAELIGFSKKRPMGLLLPSLFSELETEAMPKILDEVKKVPYLSQIVIGLDRANEAQYREALDFLENSRSTTAFFGMMGLACALWMPSFKSKALLRKKKGREEMSGIALGICWRPTKLKRSHYMTAIL